MIHSLNLFQGLAPDERPILESHVSKVILHIAVMQSTKFGGMERYLLELARQSAERGYVTRILYQAAPTSTEYLRQLRAIGADIVVADLSGGFFSSLRAAHSVIAAIRPEIINTHFLPQRMMRLVCAMGRAYGARRLVSTGHMAPALKPSLRIRLAYSGFDCVLGVSQAVCASLRAAGVPAGRLKVHHLGLIEPPAFSSEVRQQVRSSLGIPDEATVLGTIGWESDAKGMDIMLEAYESMLRTRPDVHLIQLGIDSGVSDLAKRYSHLRQAHWLGIRDNAAAYLSAVDIYVQPSRSEALGLAIIEAMAMRRPVIATAVGGIVEAVVDRVTGRIVPSEDVQALTAAMLELSEPANSGLLTELGDAGFQRYAQLFDGRKSVQSLIDSYY